MGIGTYIHVLHTYVYNLFLFVFIAATVKFTIVRRKMIAPTKNAFILCFRRAFETAMAKNTIGRRKKRYILGDASTVQGPPAWGLFLVVVVVAVFI